jgi:enterochelin esterase-like enzyme
MLGQDQMATIQTGALRLRFAGLAHADRAARDERLDFLRGLAVLAMVVDHIGGHSPLYTLTGGDQFFTSAAEAFITISGFLVGVVYRHLAETRGLGVALRRLLERAWLMYLLAVGLTLLVLPVSAMLHLPWSMSADLANPREVLWRIFTLHQTTYLADVALLYALLLAVAPCAFVLLSEGRPWLVLALSWGLWAAYHLYPSGAELPWPIDDNNLFHFSAWQVLFFSAMVLGFHRRRLRARVRPEWDGPLLVLAGLGVAVLIALRVTDIGGQFDPGGGAAPWLAKDQLGFGRIVASAVVFTFAWLLTSRLWVPLRHGLGWLLLPLGRNALFAYSAQVVIALALAAQAQVVPHPSLPQAVLANLPDLTDLANAVVQMVIVAVIWLAIRRKLFQPAPALQRAWLAGSAPLIFAVTVLLWAGPTGERSAPSTVANTVSVANSLGTPIPAEQAAAIRQELATAQDQVAPRPGVAAADRSPRSAPAGQAQEASLPAIPVVSTPEPTPAPAPRLPDLELPSIPGSLWTGSTGPSHALLQGMIRQVTFHSRALDRDMPYLVYLPPGYTSTSDRQRYPVLYLLHGASQRIDEWLSYGVAEVADRMITAQELRPLLIVMPLGDGGYWIDHADGGPKWGDYVATDLVQQVDATLRTVPEAKGRAIGGLSMGGYGALELAFTNPQIFGRVGAHSPSLHPEGTLSILGSGQDFAARDPVSLAATADGLDNLGIWLDIGASDPWLARVVKLDEALNARGINHAWTLGEGGHDGSYWQPRVPSYLRFYSAGFN